VTLDQEIDTMSHRDRLRDVEAVLLVAATVLLVVGTSLERSQAASETRQAATVQRLAWIRRCGNGMVLVRIMRKAL
jgi:hypothetical protein